MRLSHAPPPRRLFGASDKRASPPLVTGIDSWSLQLSIIKNQTGGSPMASAYPRTYLRAGAQWVKPRHRAQPLPRTLVVQSRCKSSPKGASAPLLRRRSQAFRRRSTRLPPAATGRFPQGVAYSPNVGERREVHV